MSFKSSLSQMKFVCSVKKINIEEISEKILFVQALVLGLL